MTGPAMYCVLDRAAAADRKTASKRRIHLKEYHGRWPLKVSDQTVGMDAKSPRTLLERNKSLDETGISAFGYPWPRQWSQLC